MLTKEARRLRHQSGYDRGLLNGDSFSNGRICSSITNATARVSQLHQERTDDADLQAEFVLGYIAGLAQRIRYV